MLLQATPRLIDGKRELGPVAANDPIQTLNGVMPNRHYGVV